MSADINLDALRRSEALHRLADALADDILNTPAQTLLAEAAADHGDRRALAKTFDRVLGRSVRRSTWQRVVDGSRALVAETWRVASLKPVIASIGAILIVVVAGDLYVRLQSADKGPTIASVPTGDRAGTSSPEARNNRERLALGEAQSERFRNSSAPAPQPAPPAANVAAVPPADEIPDYGNAKSVRTVTVHRDPPERGGLSAAGAAPPQQAARASPQGQTAAGQVLSKVEQPAAAARGATGNPNVASAPPQASAFAAAPAAATATPAAPSEVAPGALFDWPVRGRIIARFGPIPGSLRNDGINIAVPEGTDIHAADDGLVVYAGNDVKGYGNLVLIRHSNGFVTAYAHASQLLVGMGDSVQRGQVVAKSGHTGQVKDPQVHFEIRRGTVPIDPTRYLSPD